MGKVLHVIQQRASTTEKIINKEADDERQQPVSWTTLFLVQWAHEQDSHGGRIGSMSLTVWVPTHQI